MGNLVDRVARRLRLVQDCEPSEREQARMADEYARALGLHLPPGERVERFKRMTDGAPLVRRTPRRHHAV